jgi:hypothetical protein
MESHDADVGGEAGGVDLSAAAKQLDAPTQIDECAPRL